MNGVIAQDSAHNRLNMLVLGSCEQMSNQKSKMDFAYALFLQLDGFCLEV